MEVMLINIKLPQVTVIGEIYVE